MKKSAGTDRYQSHRGWKEFKNKAQPCTHTADYPFEFDKFSEEYIGECNPEYIVKHKLSCN
jgi:hypothetical protein